MRRRSNSKKKKTQQSSSTASQPKSNDGYNKTNDSIATTATSTSPSKPRHFLLQLAEKFPIIAITLFVFIPYGLYNAYFYIFLQNPTIVSQLTLNTVQLRPPIKVNDLRQVLIVGTISSGTKQVSYDLKNKLQLEIGHENSEASWSFVRDGTVSWFHGIRYLPRPGIDYKVDHVDLKEMTKDEVFQSAVHLLCDKLRPNMGFHPFMFRQGKCSLRQKWNDCWKDECIDIIENEWGCQLHNQDQSTCLTPFQKTLHQVRHPLQTIESLVAKFCIDGVNGAVQPVFVVFATVLFPQHNFSNMSCIEAAGYYVYEYNTAMVNAKNDGIIHDQFLVEDVSPCGIAKLSGIMNENEAVYKSNREKVMKLCHDDNSDANQKLVSTKNRYNTGLLALEWDDLLGSKNGSVKKNGDKDLQKRIKKLSIALGYHE